MFSRIATLTLIAAATTLAQEDISPFTGGCAIELTEYLTCVQEAGVDIDAGEGDKDEECEACTASATGNLAESDSCDTKTNAVCGAIIGCSSKCTLIPGCAEKEFAYVTCALDAKVGDDCSITCDRNKEYTFSGAASTSAFAAATAAVMFGLL